MKSEQQTPLLAVNEASNVDGAGWSSGSGRPTSHAQPPWKREACILAMVASGMAMMAGLLGAYVLFLNHHRGVHATSSPTMRLGVASATSVTDQIPRKKGRYEDRSAKDTGQKESEAEVKEDDSEMNRRFLSGQDDVYDHVHTSGYFDGREQGL